MPQIRTVDLAAARMIELEPAAGESMRGLKVDVTRAAKEANRDIGYGESETWTLLVWLERPKPRRARRKQTATESRETA